MSSSFVFQAAKGAHFVKMSSVCVFAISLFAVNLLHGQANASTNRSFESSPKSIALLPFQSSDDVKQIQADGFHAMLSNLFEDFDGLTLRGTRRDDEQTSATCRFELACLHDAAISRQVDLLGAGYLVRVEGGFSLALTVVSADDPDFHRHASEELLGDEENIRSSLDRLLRSAFAPHTLAGAIMVRGSPVGANIYIDGVLLGKLPLDEPIVGLIEGTHRVELRQEGYHSITKPVDVYFKELTQVEIKLSAKRIEEDSDQASESNSSTLHFLGSAGLVGVSVILGLSGATTGAGALILAQEVESRASEQQLFLPEDALFFQLGTALQWATYGLLASSAPLALLGTGWAGFALFVFNQEPIEESIQERETPTDVPDMDEIQPSLTQVHP